MWDPEMPGGALEPSRIPEEGFMDAETYKVGVILIFFNYEEDRDAIPNRNRIFCGRQLRDV
jgi:hypothetical protein